MEAFIESFSGPLFYAVLFGLMVADMIGVPLPSEAPLLYGGYLISTGDLHLLPAGIAATAGALLGAIILYWLSRKLGRIAVLRYGKWLRIDETHLDKAEVWFDHKGQAAVFFCRMIPLARTLISVPAGIAAMEPRRFVTYTTAGSAPWAFGLLALGWWLGDSWRQAMGRFGAVGLVVAAVIGVGLVVWVVKRRRAARRAASPSEH